MTASTEFMRNNFENKYLKSAQVRKTDLLFVLLCAVFLYLHLFVLPGTPIFFEEDHLSYAQDAWRMYLGESIYKDFFQLSFPGNQFLYLVLFEIFGPRFWTINFMIFLQGISSAIVCLAISRRIFENIWYSYLPPTIFLFFGFRWFGLDGSHRMFSPIFAMLAVLVLLRSASFKRILLAGLFCALSGFITQQRGILAVGAIAVYLLFSALANKESLKTIFLKQLALGVSFAVCLTLLLLPFVLSSGIDVFVQDTLLYIYYYVQDPANNNASYTRNIDIILRQGTLMSVVMFFYLALIPLIYLVVFVYLALKRKDDNISYKLPVLSVALMGGILTLGTFAPNPARYFQIAVPALILLVWMFSQISVKSIQMVRVAVIGLILFGLLLSFRTQLSWEPEILDSRSGKIAFLSGVTIERYKWLAENADQNDYVFEVYNCAVNFPLQLKNPTPATFLWNTAYTPKWMVSESIEGLEKKKARFVIWDAKWTRELEVVDEGEHLLPLLEYLRENYHIRKNFTPYNERDREMQLWERNQ